MDRKVENQKRCRIFLLGMAAVVLMSRILVHQPLVSGYSEAINMIRQYDIITEVFDGEDGETDPMLSINYNHYEENADSVTVDTIETEAQMEEREGDDRSQMLNAALVILEKMKDEGVTYDCEVFFEDDKISTGTCVLQTAETTAYVKVQFYKKREKPATGTDESVAESSDPLPSDYYIEVEVTDGEQKISTGDIVENRRAREGNPSCSSSEGDDHSSAGAMAADPESENLPILRNIIIKSEARPTGNQLEWDTDAYEGDIDGETSDPNVSESNNLISMRDFTIQHQAEGASILQVCTFRDINPTYDTDTDYSEEMSRMLRKDLRNKSKKSSRGEDDKADDNSCKISYNPFGIDDSISSSFSEVSVSDEKVDELIANIDEELKIDDSNETEKKMK